MHGIFVKEFARALSMHTPVRVVAPVSFFPLVRSRKSIPQLEKDNKICISHPGYLALPSMFFPHRWRSYYRALSGALNPYISEIDIIHVHWPYPDAYAAVRYARRHQKKVILTIHGHAGLGKHSFEKRLIQEPLDHADVIITVSNELKESISRDFGIPKQRIVVLCNGFDPAKFSPGSKTSARAMLGIPLDRPVALTVARLSPEKAIDVLIDSMGACSRKDLLLYIVGEGPLRADLAALISNAGLSHRVFLVGPVAHEALNPWFCAADFFCLPSHTEGCPVVIHEALACGLPVVASRVGAIPEIINSPSLGRLCTPGDTKGLAHILAKATETRWEPDMIAAYGRQFTWDRIARQTVDQYSTTLMSDASRTPHDPGKECI